MSPLPLCRSALLQDVTIALGQRSLKTLRRANPTLKFEVTEQEVNGVACERLDIEARTPSASLTKITLWADAIAWVYSAKHAKKSPVSVLFETHANLSDMKPEEIAELLRATLTDFNSAQQTWERHAIRS